MEGRLVPSAHQPPTWTARATPTHWAVLPGQVHESSRLMGSSTAYNASNGQTCSISTAGAITATGDVTVILDKRLKDNIETLDGSKVYDMRGVSFTKGGREGSGPIAQELLE